MKFLFLAVATILLPSIAGSADQVTADVNTNLLRAKDQALLDAIAPGDRKVWDDVLASNAVYVDENGAVMNRAEYLKQLEPLPPGASGTLRIASYSASFSGDLATVIHTDDEQENYYGQIFHAQYLMTETWRHDSGDWKLYLVHVYAVQKDPPAISLPSESMAEYAGRYSGGSDLNYVVEWDGKQLKGGRLGKTSSPLQVEVRDVLFIPGQPRVRKIFQRNSSGQITGFVDRREGEDLVWKREQNAKR
jgi:uncharacterized protein DUF4440